jgi:hypothetical protein
VNVNLPGARAWPTLPREFYVFFQQVANASNDTRDLTDIATRLSALEVAAKEPAGGQVRGSQSVRTSGVLPNIVTLALVTDAPAPGNGYVYGTDAAGAKGWRTSASMLEHTDDTTLDVGADGVTTIGLANLTATASTDLTYPRVVALDGAGNAYYPDLTVPADVARIVGVTLHAAVAGTPVGIVTSRDFTEPAWSWSPGRIYCALSGGALTQIAPATGAIVEVARAVTPTTIRVGIQPGILR